MSAATATTTALRPVGLLACGLLLLAGAALPAWAWSGGLHLSLPELLVCGLPALIGLAVTALPGRDARQYLGRIVVCLLMLPILLLIWGDSLELEVAPPTVTPAATAPTAGLDGQRLFAGAVAEQTLPAAGLPHSGLQSMRAAAFRDGLELRLQRFADAAAASRQFDWMVEAGLGRVERLDGRTGLRLSHGAWLERHGRELLELRAPEPLLRQRLQALPLPETTPAPPDEAPAAARAFWPFGLGYSLAHLLFFLGFLLWAGGTTTVVPAEPGRAAVTPTLLAARLDSLDRAGLPLRVSSQGPGQWQVEHLGPDPARRHRLLLRLDAPRRHLLVREIASADAAAPLDEDEARMGSIADADYRGGARPAAQQVWGTAFQTTLIEPERLARLRRDLHLQEGRAELAPGCRDPLDGEGMVSLLCALVTGSGYRWQPVFWRPRR